MLFSDNMNPEMEEMILKEIQDMKRDIIEVKIIVKELGYDLQEIRPEYAKKLKKIDRGKFLSRKEFENALRE